MKIRTPLPLENIYLPARRWSASTQFWVRVLIAVACLLLTVLVVLLEKAGYRDGGDPTGEISALDAFYYATVSLSTTGYGDITPISDLARLTNILIITPLRFIFLIVLISTTVEVLTKQIGKERRVNAWRRRLKDHTVVIGYGVTGRAAVRTLLDNGHKPESITVVVEDQGALAQEAAAQGLAVIAGDGTRETVLEEASVRQASAVLVAVDRDDTAALVTLTARSLLDARERADGVRVPIRAVVRDSDNSHLLAQAGADTVITGAASAGQLLGASTISPALVDVVKDLLDPVAGLRLAQRRVLPEEIGLMPRKARDVVLAVVRNGTVLNFSDPGVGEMRRGDELVVALPGLGDGRGSGHVHPTSPTAGASPTSRPTGTPNRPPGDAAASSRTSGFATGALTAVSGSAVSRPSSVDATASAQSVGRPGPAPSAAPASAGPPAGRTATGPRPRPTEPGTPRPGAPRNAAPDLAGPFTPPGSAPEARRRSVPPLPSAKNAPTTLTGAETRPNRVVASGAGPGTGPAARRGPKEAAATPASAPALAEPQATPPLTPAASGSTPAEPLGPRRGGTQVPPMSPHRRTEVDPPAETATPIPGTAAPAPGADPTATER